MLVELIELCLEPKRINSLQKLENLFPDYSDDTRESQLSIENDMQQNAENNQQLLNHQPSPPIPDIYIQQLNVNDVNDYQLRQQLNVRELNVRELNDKQERHRQISNRQLKSSCSSYHCSNYQHNQQTNQPTTSKKVFRHNSCQYGSFDFNLQDNITSSQYHNHIDSILSKDLSKDVNWQSNLNTVQERNAVLFNNECMSDVTFIVSNDSTNSIKNDKSQINSKIKIPAHKFVLASGSPVFYAMFYGGLSRETSNNIELPDVDSSGFLAFLKFLYCDDISLNEDNVLSTFYCSKKYLVNYLSKACIKYLTQILNPQNAFVLLNQFRMFDDEKDFVNQCLEVIDCQADKAFESEPFVDIDESTLKLILQRETLNIKELNIYKHCLRWSEEECKRKNLDLNPRNKRYVLDKLIHLIRFGAMTLDEFANSPALDGLLTAEESNSLFLHFTTKNENNLLTKFNTKKRKGLKLYECTRFRSTKFNQNQWKYSNNKCDSIQFSTDHKIFLAGLGLYGSSIYRGVYEVKMEVTRNGEILAYSKGRLISDGTSKVHPMMFDHSIEIYPYHFYTASVIIDGSDFSFYGQEGSTSAFWNKDNKSVTFNFQCSADSTNGTGVIGGQLPSFYFYLPSLDASNARKDEKNVKK